MIDSTAMKFIVGFSIPFIALAGVFFGLLFLAWPLFIWMYFEFKPDYVAAFVEVLWLCCLCGYMAVRA